MEPALLISISSLCISSLGFILSYSVYKKTHAGQLTVRAHASAADQALRISIANSGSRPLTLTNVWVGYGVGAGNMQLIVDMLGSESKHDLLAISQLRTLPLLYFRELRDAAAKKKIVQGYHRRLWIRVQTATGPVTDAEVQIDQELGPSDASAIAWPYITSDLLLGFSRQPEQVSNHHLMK